MNRVIHFEIHATDPERVAGFYRKVFGWTIQEWTVPGVGVSSVDEYLMKTVAAGGTVALPKMPVKGVGWLAYCKDPDGNVFGVMQQDKHAA